MKTENYLRPLNLTPVEKQTKYSDPKVILLPSSHLTLLCISLWVSGHHPNHANQNNPPVQPAVNSFCHPQKASGRWHGYCLGQGAGGEGAERDAVVSFLWKKHGFLHILNFANVGHIFSMWRPCFQILSDICKGGKECSL